MKAAELRKKTKNELNKLLTERRERLRVLRFDLASGRVKNVKEISQLKREVARIITLLKENKESIS